MNRIRKGDTVEVIAGKDKGLRGEVLRVLVKDDRLVVEHVNIVKKHQKARQAGNSTTGGGIIEFEAPLNASNVMLVCTQCKARTRVNFHITAEGRKVRTCKKCHEDID